MTKKDIPLAKDSYKKSNESDSSLDTAIHNIIIQIKETTYKGSYECTYWNPLPTAFRERIQKIFTNKGYVVGFKNVVKTDEKNSLGRDVEKVEVFIKWS